MNSTIEWQHPQAFYLILPLCAVWIGLALYARARKRQAAAKFVAPTMMPRILPRESSGRFWAKTILVGLGFIFGILALARPRFGVYYEDIRARGSDIYVAIDVSRSMLAEDVPPNRLARAKADVQTLLNRLHGERVGLIAFAGVAVVKCPLTTDYNFFRLALNELSPNSVPRGGTAIGDAIRKGLEVMPKLADRDQALLLITDGDDQNSYPLDAASTAAERSVMIFTVGLGDPDSGSRVPLESGGNMMYQGAPVISKMGAQLLKDIALATNGACISAGTKGYDLGELYVNHLSKLRGAEGSERKRMRLAEQYQWFLALALLCVLADLFIRMYEPRPAFKRAKAQAPVSGAPANPLPKEGKTDVIAPAKETAPPPTPPFQGGEVIARLLLVTVALPLFAVHAGEERELVKQGLELYKKDDFDGAREKFNKAADDDAKQQERVNAALIAFDLACAYHRKGDTEHAKEQYLRAGLSRDKSVAAAADFNLGCMASENARALAGEHPENVPPEKRQEILDKLKEAVGSFRGCLEVQADHALARKNIELIRMWIKTYTDRWREIDKQKLREKSNLFEFLQYIIASERMLRASVQELPDTTTLDVLFEHRQAQKELRDEIGPLKDKIESTLKPPPQAPQAGLQPAPAPNSNANEKELAEGIKLLQGWADTAGTKMRAAETQIDSRQPKKAAAEQKDAIAELERIWEALIPFRPLLAHDLASETAIVHELKPESPADDKSESAIGKAFDWVKDMVKSNLPAPKPTPPNAAPAPKLELDSAASEELAELQETTSHRTDLLKAKAQAELEQVEKMPPQAPPKAPDPSDPKAEKQAPGGPDPEKVKAGLRKAIELAPKAVEHMNAAARQLRKGNRVAATPEAEEAKKILEEILKAQPQDEQKKQDQNKKDQQKKDQEKKDQEKKDQDKKDQDKKDQDKKGQDKKDQNKKDEGKDGEKEKQPMSKEQAEALLRKVREREQKHRKEREEQALIMGGNVPVEKDW